MTMVRDDVLISVRLLDLKFSIDLVGQTHGYLSSGRANPELY